MISQQSTELHPGECIPASVLGLPAALQAVLDRDCMCVQMLSLLGYVGVLKTISMNRKRVETIAAAMDAHGFAFPRPQPVVAPAKVRVQPAAHAKVPVPSKQRETIDATTPLFDVWNSKKR